SFFHSRQFTFLHKTGYKLTKIIGKRYQTWSKKIRFVTKADFCSIFELCKMIKLLKIINFYKVISHNAHYVKWIVV
ncbi:MAG: hypothetical protein RSB64_20870, partial [Pseudomonas sp.]